MSQKEKNREMLLLTFYCMKISIFTSIEIYDIFKYYVSRNGQYENVNKTAIENQQYVRILKVNCSLKVQFSFFVE